MSKILNDKYRLQNVLGVGAFGEVRCASVMTRQRSDSVMPYCAIKIMDQNVVHAQKEQFQFELNLLPELSHPHIIRVHEISASMLYGRFCDECGCLDFRPSDLSSEQCRNCPHDSRQHCKEFQGRPVTLIVQLENEPISNIALNNPADYKQNYPFKEVEDLQIDPVIPVKPMWKYGREKVEPQHRRLAMKIVERLRSWAPNLKVDTNERRNTTRLEVVSTESPEFEAQIVVSDNEGQLLSIRGEGSRTPNLENNLKRLLRLLL